ncbi:MAG: hypothetical protein AAFQ82_25600, partial [Myxococcota bacterium]
MDALSPLNPLARQTVDASVTADQRTETLPTLGSALAPEPVSLPRRLPGLPPEVAQAKANVIEIATAGRLDWGSPEIEAALRPHIEVLATWFAANRPPNEVELTQGSWRNEWLSNQDEIDFSAPGIALDRSHVYQVVRDGFYYNVADLRVLGAPILSTFLKGNYTLGNPARPGNAGERGLNVIELEFDINMLRIGRIPRDADLVALVDQADQQQTSRADTFEIPGPRGVQGRLYNLYVEIRALGDAQFVVDV